MLKEYVARMTLILKKDRHFVLVSFAAAALLLFIVLSITGKYRIIPIDHQYSSSTSYAYYTDLDHDGRTEKINFMEDLVITGGISMIVYTPEGRVLDQWNLEGKWGRQQRPFIGDVNGDGTDEVVLFTRIHDSIYIHCIEPLSNRILFRDRPVAWVHLRGNRYDFHVSPGFFYDYDGDGIKDIYFGITCGFALRPRRIFAYNPARDTVISSAYGCVPVKEPRMWDLDRDGSPEIFSNSFAPGNCDSIINPTVPYNDHYNWLQVWTPELRLKFTPLRFLKYPAYLYLGIIRGVKEDYLFVYHDYMGKDNYHSRMVLLDGKGRILKAKREEKLLPTEGVLITPEGENGYLFLVEKSGEVFRVDTSLALVKYTRFPELYSSPWFQALDVDGDGRLEYIFGGKTLNDFFITRSDLKHVCSFSVDRPPRNPVFSVIRNGKDAPVLVLDGTGGGDQYYLRYGETFIFRYWFLFFSLFFLFVWFLFYFAGKVREFRRLKVADTRRQVYELQLRAFQNQLDPHFTFNAITSLGTLIYTEKKEEAYDYLVRFSGLIRKILESSDKIAHTLEEELDFVKNYLELQHLRMKGKIGYDIQVAPGVNTSERVPRMIIQTHVENALKHGLQNSGGKGHLWIRVACVDHLLTIEIEDNGIGRKKARQLNQQSTRLGLKVTEQFYTLINKYNRKKIAREIIDLYDEGGEPAGTRVVLRIPEGIVYEL